MKVHGNKNRALSKEHCKKISEALMGRKLSEINKKKIGDAQRGEKSKFWKGGLTQDKEYMREQGRLKRQKRRSLMRNSEGSFTLEEWESVKLKYGYMCPACSKEEPDIKLTIDHIIPLVKGGTSYIDNIQPLCKSCNGRKQDKIIAYDPNGQLRMVM